MEQNKICRLAAHMFQSMFLQIISNAQLVRDFIVFPSILMSNKMACEYFQAFSGKYIFLSIKSLKPNHTIE